MKVGCTECGEEWETETGGTFTCPGCGAETQQKSELGWAYFDGPLKVIEK